MTETRVFLGVCMALLVGLAACGSKPAANNSVPGGAGSGPDMLNTVKPGETTPLPSHAVTLVAGVATAAGNGLVITPKIQGQSFLLKVGDTFSVQIPTIPTEGFTWEAQDLDTTILTQLGAPVFTADSTTAGAGGIVTINFKVVGPGTTALNLIYTQPSINGAPSLYTNSFGVTIEAK